MNGKVWLITGCSTGFGRELAQIAARKGDIVVGTLRQTAQIADFEALAPGQLHGILLDVCLSEQVQTGVQQTLEKFGRIDVLVNNAGYGSLGAIEEVPEEEMRRQFEVNVFGAIAMVKAVLPAMRAQKSGYILNISSIAGIQGFPGVGIYNASKFALEGMGEALAAEVRHLGIKVINVEPGPFRTDWAGRSATYIKGNIADYEDSAYRNLQAIADNSGKQVGDPIKGAEAMYALTELENPPVHLPLGGPAYKRVRSKAQGFLEEVEQFEYLGLPTDYDA
ncbi:MAG: SDR family NAD(P)-dependent oxidoreductase [Microscillaceae bacterium]|nr:SDR family NAD(P)-dependent oxidoreductase [Microscillaceae bacterium]